MARRKLAVSAISCKLYSQLSCSAQAVSFGCSLHGSQMLRLSTIQLATLLLLNQTGLRGRLGYRKFSARCWLEARKCDW
ncbi:exported hypothetical protein [Cupriavidus phytorum]|uniref:Secreted protein n=1 Tax=Cupriavidus taiwanensis TaxID=164546 RepID=A0A375B9G9_9BURK|nr:exported hypothetical protein [Cupriavidus taiwanensis]